MIKRCILFLMYKDTVDFLISGGKQLSGEVVTNTSKNGSVALLCASLLNRGKTRLSGIARIEEVNRLIEILEDIGVSVVWESEDTLCIEPPETFTVEGLMGPSVSRIRSALMLIPPVAHKHDTFTLGLSGGCKMGKRTIVAHTYGLAKLGIAVAVEPDYFEIKREDTYSGEIVMCEASDTATINLLMAAALIPKVTTISFASANYQVQEVCFFLEKLGVAVEGIGTSTLRVRGVENIEKEVEYTNSEDPIESMLFIAVAAATHSSLTITRVPIDFLALELLTLELMSLSFSVSDTYFSENGKTKLVDITVNESSLVALEDKIHALPYPGINTDNLPFFVPIATQAEGTTLIHDWMWENRSVYYTEMNRLGAQVEILDPHRVYVHGVTPLTGGQVVCPPALRPACIILVAMLAAKGESILRDTYVISRGYADIVRRFSGLGADIQVLK